MNARKNTRSLSTNALLFLFALFFSVLILFVFIFAIALGFTSHEVHYVQAIPNGQHTQLFQKITAVTNDQDIYLQPKNKAFFYYVIHENDFTTHFTSDMFFQTDDILSMLCKDDSADIYRVDITLDDNSSLFGDGCNVVELRLEQSDHSIVELGTPEYLAHPHDYYQSYWFPVWGICIGSTLLTILVWWLPFVYRKRKISLVLVDQPDDLQTARFNRQQMLKRVRAIWIDGVLEHSLHQAALQELGVPDPHWNLAAQPPFMPSDDLAIKATIVKLIAQRAERSLATGVTTEPTIVKFYDQVREKVLILGQPGSGKTTLLLQLASELLARAEEEEHYPLPVILPLGSWRSRHTTLSDWMEEELRERYHVPKDVACAWVEQKQLVPLLDGLDEIPLNIRKACSSVLATESLTWPAMVVCARSMAGLTPLNFLTTLKIQPLTSQQIDAYLVSGGSKFEALRAVLRDDSGLQEIVSTPSMLTILALTYQNAPICELPSADEDPEARRQHILATYAQQRLARVTEAHSSALAKLMSNLAWLARQLKTHRKGYSTPDGHLYQEFFLENLDPTWLDSRRASRIYRWLFTLVIMLPFVAFSIQQFTMLSSITDYVPAIARYERDEVLVYAIGSLVMGLIAGFGVGWRANWPPINTFPWTRKKVRLTLLFAGGIFLPIFVLIFGWIGLAYGTLWQGLCGGLLLGGLLTLSVGLVPLGIMSQPNVLEKSTYTTPNEGMRRSLQHGLLTALYAAIAALAFFITLPLLSILLSVLIRGLTGHTSSDLSSFAPPIGVIIVSLATLVGFFAGGGYPATRQFVLRLFLWRTGALPFKWLPVLECATQALLLSRVGGGYVFAHPLLLDYFARLEQYPESNED